MLNNAFELNMMEVACAVPTVHLADPKKNAKEITDIILKADKEGCAVVVFPELSITGYTCQDLFFQKKLIQSAKEALLKILEDTKDTNILYSVGLPLSKDGRLYNVVALCQSGQVLAFVPKTFIPENREYYERRWFASGRDLDTTILFDKKEIVLSTKVILESVENDEIKIGAEICEDLWASDNPSIALANHGCIIILNSSASNETIAKANYREQLVSLQSAKLNCAYLYTSCGYGESTQDLVFGGDAIIAEKGIVLSKSKRFNQKSDYIKAQIDCDILLNDRRVQSSYRDSFTPSDYHIIPVNLNYSEKLNREFIKNPFVPDNKAEREERCEEIFNIQSTGLGTRVKKLNDAQMIIGLSGGLDSTLALLVCKEVVDKFGLDPTKITAVTMPGFGTTGRTYNNAVDLAKELGVKLREIPISEASKIHLRDIGHDMTVLDEVYENAQARERTQVLMDIANQENGIVVGTGDLSELALGWATYNGDHMSMYGVNSSIPKTLVRYLVKYYADNSDESLKKTLYDILDTPVSPELLPPDKDGKIAQKTEEKIGPYELHDFFLYHLLRNGFNPKKVYLLAKETFKDEFTDEEIKKWLRTFVWRFFTQQFKRSTLPDGPKVGSVTLSPRGDLRMPTDIRPDMWIEELENL